MNDSIGFTRPSNATRACAAIATVLLAATMTLTLVGCSRTPGQQPGERTDTDATTVGDIVDPPELPISDFAELGFSLDTGSFNVFPDSATRRTWPNGYRLESATWTGETGYPRIMINVLDVSQSGESFTRSSQLVKPTSERINDLLPGEEIDLRGTGQLNNNYGRTNFQIFTVDSRMSCAFINQFLTNDPANIRDNDFGEIIFEAILCDQNADQISRPYLQRFTNAFRIEKSSL